MAICRKLQSFLDENEVRYVTIVHSPAFTAQQLAAKVHIKGKNLVKSVMIRASGRHYMAVTSANQRLSLDRIGTFLDTDDVRLEREDEFRELFEDCELGAMPPFGNLYGIPVVVDDEIYDDDEIAFNGGNHHTVVKLDFAEFERLVRPTRATIAEETPVAAT